MEFIKIGFNIFTWIKFQSYTSRIIRFYFLHKMRNGRKLDFPSEIGFGNRVRKRNFIFMYLQIYIEEDGKNEFRDDYDDKSCSSVGAISLSLRITLWVSEFQSGIHCVQEALNFRFIFKPTSQQSFIEYFRAENFKYKKSPTNFSLSHRADKHKLKVNLRIGNRR